MWHVRPLAAAAIVALMLAACAESTGTKQGLGTVMGAVAGGIAGSQVGKGRGQLVATGVGTLLGAFLGSEIGKSLDRADQLAIQQSLQQSLETAPKGTVSSWHNPDSGNAGTVNAGEYGATGRRHLLPRISADGDGGRAHGGGLRHRLPAGGRQLEDRVRLRAAADWLDRLAANPLENDRFLEGACPSSGNWRSSAMKPTAMLLSIVLVLTAAACARRDDPPPPVDEGAINFVRNTEFSGPRLRVFLTLEDGSEVSVNTTDDAVETRPGVTPIPGHQAQNWTFIKDVEDGTSVAYALVSWAVLISRKATAAPAPSSERSLL